MLTSISPKMDYGGLLAKARLALRRERNGRGRERAGHVA
jgi:hypothetical protein